LSTAARYSKSVRQDSSGLESWDSSSLLLVGVNASSVGEFGGQLSDQPDIYAGLGVGRA